MADAVKAFGQHMHQESPDKLVRAERHGLEAGLAVGAIVFVFEGDAIGVGLDQPAVGDGNPMRISRQVLKDGFGPGERSLGICHPFGAAMSFDEGGESVRAGQPFEPAVEVKSPLSMGGGQHGQEQPAEQRREHRDRQKVAFPAGDPFRSIRRQTTSGDNHVDMRVMRHRRTPRMEHGCDADARAEMFGIGGDGERGFGGGLEQDVVDHRLVLPGDVCDRGRQREDQMEVADLKQLGLAFGQPFAGGASLAFGAVSVATTIKGDDGMAACLVLVTPAIMPVATRA
jgi:hypothetical protein